MRKINELLPAALLVTALLTGCSSQPKGSDAYGNFEATTLLVSAESNGRLLWFGVEEGNELAGRDTVGLVDTVALALKKGALVARMRAVRSQAAAFTARKKVMLRQLENLKTEQTRVHGLFAGHAATQKQVDDIDGQVQVMRLQISELEVQRLSVLDELEVIRAEIAQVNDQISRSYVVTPEEGTVLEKYVEAGELVMPGKVLFKLGRLQQMYLRVYVDETLLPQIRVGGKTRVLFDNGQEMDTLWGEVAWIAGEAEFTPKIIQTRKERVNLVYAVKIRVNNDGRLKIGMPGEADFLRREK